VRTFWEDLFTNNGARARRRTPGGAERKGGEEEVISEGKVEVSLM